MNLLILQPTLRNFEYNLFSLEEKKTIMDAKVDSFTGIANEKNEWINSLIQIKQNCQQAKPNCQVDTIILTVLFGGDIFTKSTVVNHEVIAKLDIRIN